MYIEQITRQAVLIPNNDVRLYMGIYGYFYGYSVIKRKRRGIKK